MNASIYKHEFQARIKSVITWSIGLAVLIVFFFSIFPSFSEQAAALNEFVTRLPPQMRAAFGLENLDLATMLGFYSFLFVFVQLCLAIQASNYGFGLVSIEETELTADFLLSKPVSRAQVMNSKLLAAITSLAITNLVVWACTYLSILLFGSGRAYDARTLLLLLLGIIIFQLVFLSVGLIISLLVRRVRSVTPYALGLSFGAYVLNGLSGVFGDVKLELITPFKHLDPAYIVHNASYNTSLVLADVAIILVCLGTSYWLYIRRDIPAVS